MAAQIHLQIVTPEGVRFSEEVDEFTAPSVQGQFGVLPAHRPLLAGLKTGIVTYRTGDETTSVAVGPGFAKVSDDQANLIVQHFMKKDEVDAVVARKDLKESQTALDKLPSDAPTHEFSELVAASRWAATRLELYGDPPPPTIILAQEMRLLARENYADQDELEQDIAEASTENK